MRSHDLSGERFGRLVAVAIAWKTKSGETRWRCKCDCGNEVCVVIGSLRAGRSRSCGCLKNDVTSARMVIHGQVGSPEYEAWSNMRQRCSNPNHPQYGDYGGRGISVCNRWQVFETFFADMGKRPQGLSIERKDNNGDYEPANCVWETKIKQTRNTRRSYLISFNGETKCLAEWMEVLGKNYERVRGRLRLGWSFEEAIA